MGKRHILPASQSRIEGYILGDERLDSGGGQPIFDSGEGGRTQPLEGARVIDFNTDPDWKPVTRSNGFGNARSARVQLQPGKFDSTVNAASDEA